MRLALPLSACLLVVGCLGPGNLEADGGHMRVNCDTFSSTWPVKVVDLAGAPAAGADVTAVNDGDQSLKVTGKTDAQGVFLVDGAKVGVGNVTVSGSFNGLNTDIGRFTFAPSECAGSVVTPRDLRLQLQR